MGLLGWRDRRAHEADFVAFYAERADHLRSTAYLLCRDWHLAEDLVQTAFTKLYRHWHRVERHDALDQYARRVLLRAFLDERRRPWRREYATEPGSSALDSTVRDSYAEADSGLHAALMRLPRRRRAVLVLRFWADMSVEQCAQALECSTGTVKSQTARGLAQLRELLGDGMVDAEDHLAPGPHWGTR